MSTLAAAVELPIRFAGATLDKYRHVCAFFDTPDEEYRVLLPFIKEGFDKGEKAFHIVDPKLRDDHCRRLADAGIDVAAAESGGSSKSENGKRPIFEEATSIRAPCSR